MTWGMRQCEDPSGNGMETWEVAAGIEGGVTVTPGIYVGRHGGKWRVLHGNPSPSAEAAELMDLDEGGKAHIEEL